jgi:hypothetical protein
MKDILTEWKRYVNEIKANFDEATNCWYYTTLDDADIPEHVLKVLEDNAIKAASRGSVKCKSDLADCMTMPDIWQRIFRKNGIDCVIQTGFYVSEEWGDIDQYIDGTVDFPQSTDHNWIMIEGNILFDPTACQFGTEIDLSRYVTKDLKRYT